MSRTAVFKEDAELQALIEEEERLKAREREFAELPKRIEQERRDRESTIPPLSDYEDRTRRKAYEESVTTRQEVVNVRREQGRSVMLLLMLLAATVSLIWWGLQLMQG
ncbi:MAG: hypothetical protein QM627_12005 [Luteolibacter sp.]